MPRGIEHRDADSVVSAYKLYDKPSFAVFAGKEIIIAFPADNIEEGERKLCELLEMIESSNTSTVYTLKVYGDVPEITSKTPVSGSTTFMLNADTPVKTENGMMIIDRGAQRVGNTGANMTQMQFMMDQMEQMRKMNERMMNDLHEARLKEIEAKYKSQQIAATQNEGNFWEKAIERIIEKPEILHGTIDRISGIFKKSDKNFIVNPTVPVAGTDKTAEPMAKEEIIDDDEDLEEQDEQDEKESEEEEAFHNRQDDALEIIENRIGIEKLTEVLETVAQLSDKDLNKLLIHLD